MKRSAEERISQLDKKMDELKAKKRAIQNREKEKERKARTKRLIRIGAEIEAYCGEITDIEAFKKYLSVYAYAIKKTQKNETSKNTAEQS